MNKRMGYVVAGAFGMVALGGAVAAGFAQQAIDTRSPERTEIGRSLSERQALERRRGRMAEVAIAGTTVQ
jgi:hypothetical protein